MKYFLQIEPEQLKGKWDKPVITPNECFSGILEAQISIYDEISCKCSLNENELRFIHTNIRKLQQQLQKLKDGK